jgi:ferric-dicitrate binding protein FerR (iron transport regulator)
MKNISLSIIALLLAACLASSQDEPARKREVAGIITGIYGSARILGEGDLKWNKAEKGQLLYEGDKLRTDTKSKLAMNFRNRISMAMNVNSNLSVAPIDKAANELIIKLISGQVRVTVLPPRKLSFKLLTDIGLIKTNGADFDVEIYTRLNTKVYKGDIEVANEFGKTAVREGEQNSTIALNPPGKTERNFKKDDWHEVFRPADERKVKLEIRTEKQIKKKFELKFKKAQ